MTARTIKTAEQIHESLLNLQEDLYFSFGIPKHSTDRPSVPGTPDFDPRVHVQYSDRIRNNRQREWANETASMVQGLLFSFSEHETGRPEQIRPEGPGEKRYVKAVASRPKPKQAKATGAAPTS